MRDSDVRFFRSLAREAVAHPRLALVIVALITLASAPGIRWLRLRTDGHALLSENAPEVIYDKSVREKFGIQDNIVTVVRSRDPNGIFNPTTLRLTRDLTAEFQRLPGVDPARVISLATEPGLRFRPGLETNPGLIGPALTNRDGLVQLREDLRRIQIYTGTLVSLDEKSTAILIGVPSVADRDWIYRDILDVIDAHPGGTDEIGVTGAPVAESLLGIQILEDLGVPQAWLGSGAGSVRGGVERRWPDGWRQFPLWVARRVGLVPMAALVMLVTLLVCFRNPVAALLPLPGVIAVLLFVAGWMGWSGTPIYLTMAVMPVLLTVLSVTNDIYLFNRYFALIRARPGAGREELLGETFDSLAWPVACTAFTATAGFLSFGFSPLAPVRAFGIFTGLGVLFGLFFSLTAVPAMLALIPPAWLLSRRGGRGLAGSPGMAAGFASLGRVVVRRRWGVGAAVVGIALLTPMGLRHLVVQDSWTSGFDPDSEFRRVTQLVNEKFFGMHLLYISLDAPQTLSGVVISAGLEPGTITLPADGLDDPMLIRGSAITLSTLDPSGSGATGNAAALSIWHSKIESASWIRNRMILAGIDGTNAPPGFWEIFSRVGQARYEIPVQSHVRPEMIRIVGGVETFIRERSRYAVGGALGPWEYLTTTRFMSRPNDPDARQLSDNSAEIKLLWDYYSRAVGPRRLRQAVDTNYWQSLTTVFLKDANFVDTARLMSDIRDYEREHLTAKGIKIGFAGDVAVSQSLIHGIVVTQMQSLIWSLAGIFVVTSLFGGSLRWGFYCLLPSLMAVVVKFAVMGWLKIPLGVATSMFAAMTLGIGVNCAIHLLESYRQSQAAGASSMGILGQALSLTGPPAMINTLAMSLGFGVLMLSQVPANARLAILLVLGLVNCLFFSLLMLPLLLHWWPLTNSREDPAISSRHES